MEESNSSQPPRCPCGFWGSPKTLGLCSKCYQEQMESSKEALESEVGQSSVAPASTSKSKSGAKAAPKPSLAHSGHATSVTSEDLAPTPCRSSSSSTLLPPDTGELVLAPAPPKPPSSAAAETFSYPHMDVSHYSDASMAPSGLAYEKVSSTSCSSISLGKFTDSLPQNELRCSKSQELVADRSPPSSLTAENQVEEEQERKGTKRKAEEDGGDEQESRPVQKNKRRCFQCSVKLELAQRQIGTCRCGYVFCPLHRLPELHNCEFDHKEDGRREARQKMVKPTRHLGTSFRRMDSDS